MGLQVTGMCSSPLACLPRTPRSFLPSTLLHSYFGFFCNRHDIFPHKRTCLQRICLPVNLIIDIFVFALGFCRLIYTTCYSWASSREAIRKMYFGKQFWQSLACFVIGGIITVIFIKILEWQRDHNNEEQGERRILVPVQEVGDGEREEPMEIRRFPREQDDF